MKNMKRLIALASAFAITMSMGVSAFAEYDTATYDPETNVVALSDDANVTGAAGSSITMADGTEYTVIIISEADQHNVTADSLYYLNQGTSAEGFWATDGMGIRLADGTTELAEGNYIVRIGDKAGNIVEIEFTVSNAPTGKVIYIGDIDGNGVVEANDYNQVRAYANFTDAIKDIYPGIVGTSAQKLDGTTIYIGDIDGNGVVEANDYNQIRAYANFTDAIKDIYPGVVGTPVTITE